MGSSSLKMGINRDNKKTGDNKMENKNKIEALISVLDKAATRAAERKADAEFMESLCDMSRKEILGMLRLQRD